MGAEIPEGEAELVSEKALLLDEALGGISVVHREVQGHESHRFLALFKETGMFGGGRERRKGGKEGAK
jgi:hypothetical protein